MSCGVTEDKSLYGTLLWQLIVKTTSACVEASGAAGDNAVLPLYPVGESAAGRGFWWPVKTACTVLS